MKTVRNSVMEILRVSVKVVGKQIVEDGGIDLLDGDDGGGREIEWLVRVLEDGGGGTIELGEDKLDLELVT